MMHIPVTYLALGAIALSWLHGRAIGMEGVRRNPSRGRRDPGLTVAGCRAALYSHCGATKDYPTREPSPHWNAAYDFNGNGEVDDTDYAWACEHLR